MKLTENTKVRVKVPKHLYEAIQAELDKKHGMKEAISGKVEELKDFYEKVKEQVDGGTDLDSAIYFVMNDLGTSPLEEAEEGDVTSTLAANLSKVLNKTKDDGLGGNLENAVEDAIDKTKTNESKGKNSISEYYNLGGGPEELVINTMVALMAVTGVSAGVVAALKGAVSSIKKSKEDKKANEARGKETINEYYGLSPQEAFITEILIGIIATAGIGAAIKTAAQVALDKIKAKKSANNASKEPVAKEMEEAFDLDTLMEAVKQASKKKAEEKKKKEDAAKKQAATNKKK